VSLFVWVIIFDLSDLGDPASSYATAGLALRIILPHKPHHYVKVEAPSGGGVDQQMPECVHVPSLHGLTADAHIDVMYCFLSRAVFMLLCLQEAT
jgi:hypothetical protein